MLVKLAFVMQRLKKYLCHDQQRWGGGQFFDFMGGNTAVMRRDIELMGVPPTRENPDIHLACYKLHVLSCHTENTTPAASFEIFFPIARLVGLPLVGDKSFACP